MQRGYGKMRYLYRSTTRYKDVDKMGYVHNSVYQVYFEEARIDMVKSEGYPYSRVEEEGVIFPISSAHLDYKKPIRYDENFIVEVYFEYMKSYSFKIAYKIVDEAGAEICSGYTIHASVLAKDNDFYEIPEAMKVIGKKYYEKQ